MVVNNKCLLVRKVRVHTDKDLYLLRYQYVAPVGMGPEYVFEQKGKGGYVAL